LSTSTASVAFETASACTEVASGHIALQVDKQFIQAAIQLSERAGIVERTGLCFGAVVVKEGTVTGKGYNQASYAHPLILACCFVESRPLQQKVASPPAKTEPTGHWQRHDQPGWYCLK